MLPHFFVKKWQNVKKKWHFAILTLALYEGEHIDRTQWPLLQVLHLHPAVPGPVQEGDGWASRLWEEYKKKWEPKTFLIFSYVPSLGLNILRAKLPRTFVVLMAPADVTMVLNLVNKPKTCVLSHLYECPCLFGNDDQGGRGRVHWLWTKYRWVFSVTYMVFLPSLGRYWEGWATSQTTIQTSSLLSTSPP